jgi:hypothetical protein
LVQQRRLEVVDVDRVLDDVHREVIGFTVGNARLDAAAGHPQREGVGVMIAPPLWSFLEVAL